MLITGLQTVEAEQESDEEDVEKNDSEEDVSESNEGGPEDGGTPRWTQKRL